MFYSRIRSYKDSFSANSHVIKPYRFRASKRTHFQRNIMFNVDFEPQRGLIINGTLCLKTEYHVTIENKTKICLPPSKYNAIIQVILVSSLHHISAVYMSRLLSLMFKPICQCLCRNIKYKFTLIRGTTVSSAS